MKITIAQLNYHIGNFQDNLKKMLDAVETAKSQDSDLICFSELATVGYPPRDFLEFNDFIRLAEETVDALAKVAHGIGIIIGSPTRNPVLAGKDLFNSAVFLADGKIKEVRHKALLPTYDIFDEYRYFERGTEFKTVEYKGKQIALTVCEDIWDLPLPKINEENPLYTICPLDEMMPQKPDFIINISASPFAHDHAKKRIQVLRANATKYQLPVFYINHIGAQTEIIFDGGSVVMSPNGQVFNEMPYFEESVKTFDLEKVKRNGKNTELDKDKISLIHDALVTGVRNYFEKLGFKKAILGLSGGIDSAVAVVLAARALGKENVTAL